MGSYKLDKMVMQAESFKIQYYEANAKNNSVKANNVKDAAKSLKDYADYAYRRNEISKKTHLEVIENLETILNTNYSQTSSTTNSKKKSFSKRFFTFTGVAIVVSLVFYIFGGNMKYGFLVAIITGILIASRN